MLIKTVGQYDDQLKAYSNIDFLKLEKEYMDTKITVTIDGQEVSATRGKTDRGGKKSGDLHPHALSLFQNNQCGGLPGLCRGSENARSYVALPAARPLPPAW